MQYWYEIKGDRNYKRFAVTEGAVKNFEKWLATAPGGKKYSKSILKSIYMDAGGIMSMDEKRVDLEANGCKFKFIVRHLPVFDTTLILAPECENAKGCVLINTFPCIQNVIDFKTRDELVKVLYRYLRENLNKIRDADKERTEKLKRAGIINIHTVTPPPR